MSNQRSCSHIPSSSQRRFHVFLSFRGEDTRKGFTSHLHYALQDRGLYVFKDDKLLEKGKSISPEIIKAIENSSISVIVFSRNYAFSSWCLDELIKIVDCMEKMKQIVVPIFYDVHPSVVRKQTGKFREAFLEHEEKLKNNMEKVQKWKTALTKVANLNGWHLVDGNESEFIREIVKDILNKLPRTTPRTLKGFVGSKRRLEILRRLMDTKSDNDVLMIGINGMGGIGKTRIARALYESVSFDYEGSSFLADVREISKKDGMVPLQRKLLSQITRETDIEIWDVYDGVNMISSILWFKKVLIVIDDVDEIHQLEKLIGDRNWFGLGSRIIITTRDTHLLTMHGVDHIYTIEKLDDKESLQLLSLKAFKNYPPSSEYMELAKHVVKYACGLPLALEVLGSRLSGRKPDEWESTLDRLNKDSEKGILDNLQISIDGLNEKEKEIFLDIACFFKGKNKEHVTRIMDGCDLIPTLGIRVLVEKSLITITDDNLLWMHDLLQQLGQQIVKKQSLKEPGKRSRLWNEEDIRHVLTKNTGTEVVEGLILEKEIHFSVRAEVFEKMTNLRLLSIRNVWISEGLEYLSNELRLLEWDGYPLKSLPSSFQLDKVVELKMHKSHIEELWKETKPLDKLKVICLSHSENLKSTPDFSKVPNLEELILEGCTRLHEIHASLLVHKKLILLNLKDCASLIALPSKIDMKSLEKLDLSGCLKLKKFPEMVLSMESLSKLFLDQTSIKELPFPTELLKRLVVLSLRDCKNLVSLPSNINFLESLETLNISGCSKLKNLPENFWHLECLEKLDVNGTTISQPVSSFYMMKNLKELSFRGCKVTLSNSKFPRSPFHLISRISNPISLVLASLSGLHSLTHLDLHNVCSLASLDWLRLRGNNFVSLIGSINHLPNLEEFTGCNRLQSMHLLNSMNSLNLPDYNNGFLLLKAASNSRVRSSDIIIHGSEIPKLFSHQSDGSLIRIRSHRDLKLKGFAPCAVFLGQQKSPSGSKFYYFILYKSTQEYSRQADELYHVMGEASTSSSGNLLHVMDEGSTSSPGNLIEFHQDFVAPEMDVATNMQSFVDCDGEEPSDIDNSDDNKPQPRRQKTWNSLQHPQG